MMKLLGLPTVLKNLNKEIKKMEGTTVKGLIRAGIMVRTRMGTSAPLVPVDTRNLDHSFFLVTSEGKTEKGASPKFKGEDADNMMANHASAISTHLHQAQKAKRPTVVLGFSASYAWFVHENIGAHFRKPNSGAKFFEAALHYEQGNMLKVIAQEAKIK